MREYFLSGLKLRVAIFSMIDACINGSKKVKPAQLIGKE